jgi:FkbM family methyltransferase
MISLRAALARQALWSGATFPGRWRIQRWAERRGAHYKQCPPRRIDMSDFDFLVDPAASLDVYLNGLTRNTAIEMIIRKYVKPGANVIDVGASIGWTARLMSGLVGAEFKVHAFEPLQAAHRNLLRNVEAAPLKNIHTYKAAASDAAGRINLYLGSEDATALGTMRLPESGSTSVVEAVEALTLDSLMDTLGPISFVKIDVEGAEHKVVNGMLNLIARWRPVLAIELTDGWLRRLGSSSHGLGSHLASLGYDLFLPSSDSPVRLADLPIEQVDLVAVPARAAAAGS